jgi:hypothetical protein
MTEPMTSERLAEIDRRIDALNEHATSGDWHYLGSDEVLVYPPDGEPAELVATIWGESDSDEERAVGEFVAHTREDVPALRAEVARLRAGIEAALERIDAHDHGDAPVSEHWKWAEVRESLTGPGATTGGAG